MQGVERIRTLIVGVRRRWLAAVALRAIGIAAAVSAAPALAAGIAYWALAPEGGALLLMAAIATLLSLAGLVFAARTIERRPDDRRVARFVEERTREHTGAPMDDSVVSAVQVMSLPAADPGAALSPLIVGAAVRRLEGIAPRSLVSAAELRRAGCIAASGLVVLGVTLLMLAPALTHLRETAQLRLFPQSVTVEVVPGDTRLVAGHPLRIIARVHARGTDLSRVQPRLVVSAGGDERTVDMVRAGETFAFAFESVDRTFTYRVVAATASSPDYTVTALFPPRVKRIEIDYEYPSFSGLAPRTDEDAGDIYAPQGTRVRLRVEADKPIASGELVLSNGASSLTGDGDRTLLAELVLARDDSYRIRLLDRDGLRSDGDSEYFIRLMEDRPPDVRILRPSADQAITPLEEVSIEARAEDDYGISRLDLVYSVAGGKERVVPFGATTGTETQRTGSYVLAAENLNVRPGDVITYYARARDVGRGKRPTETTSDIFFLEVRPFNAEFEAAQSQAGGAGGGDPQIDALIAAQKEIISATWNVERRAAAGRSADDIKAIAQAQADLKARVDRLLAGSRGRRGRGFFPQDIVQRPPQRPGAEQADPITAAAEAMTRAIEQLASAKTRDAIPHEMAALNGLLQAQAEVRRRQVMQQQANSSGRGWGNRQTQDLSALFDKELQRQQRTNYEQRSQVEERQDQAQKDDQELLDRIRDLARRQEELNRRQRELEKLNAEERKRQLERLMREQQELQREAEQLSGERGRAAADQMRRAANDLQREDGESAARSGERAAEQLRRAEQQMRGGSADARQRAAADLQAEAQQIAQEQRRIAAEAERLEKSGEGKAEDARRRLAADKDRLADRVEAMQREAERLGRASGTGDEQARAREAAAALERGRVGERMRASADAMRDGSQPPSAERERELTREVEQALEKLGGSASAEAQRAAGELQRTRELRDKLDQLEAKMRDAEGRKGGEPEKLRQEYEQELRRARESLGRQSGSTEQRAGAGSTPEEHEYSRSAPGTEAFKQDRSAWESLRKDVNRALEEHDAAVARRLAKAMAEDRLAAGGSEGVPEQYRRLVAKYYEALARAKK